MSGWPLSQRPGGRKLQGFSRPGTSHRAASPNADLGLSYLAFFMVSPDRLGQCASDEASPRCSDIRFRANQGVLLAGAVAYYTLLSLVPLLIRRPAGALAHRPRRSAALHATGVPRIYRARAIRMLAGSGTADVPGAPRGDGGLPTSDHVVLQRLSVHDPGERHVGDLCSPRRNPPTPLPCISVDALHLRAVSGLWLINHHRGVRPVAGRGNAANRNVFANYTRLIDSRPSCFMSSV